MYPAPNTAVRTPILPDDLTHALEAVLPLSLVRTHTKTDDTPRVTDEQLRLYRQAAFEQCELYTGLVITGERTITQSAETQGHPSKFRRVTKLRLKHPARDGKLYFYGRDLLAPYLVQVEKGAMECYVPVMLEALDVSPCCSPCGRGAENFGLKVQYRTGFDCPENVPATAKTGALKYIAWLVRNPGDVYQSVAGKARFGQGGQEGTNATVVASGALDDWRSLKPTAV